jgi:protease I
LIDLAREREIFSPVQGKVRGWKSKESGDEFQVDVPLDRADPRDYDALLLPGGVMNPDKLRIQARAVQFVKSFFEEGKPVAVICHGPWTIVEAGRAKGRRIASWLSLKTALEMQAPSGGDQEVVIDGNLVSSRKPDDIPAFNRGMIELFFKSRKIGQLEPRVT